MPSPKSGMVTVRRATVKRRRDRRCFMASLLNLAYRDEALAIWVQGRWAGL